jgi:hypothetical protein
MMVMEAIADRLGESELRELPVSRVELRVSQDALYNLICEVMHSHDFNVRRTGRLTYAIYTKDGLRAFNFRMDTCLPGTSFSVRRKK